MPGNEIVLLMMSPSFRYFWHHSIVNTFLLFTVNNLPPANVKHWLKGVFNKRLKWQGWPKGEKNQNPKISAGLPMKPPKSPWPKIPILNFRSLKKKFYERSYNAGKKWKLNLQLFIHFSILMAGICPISTKVMYTTLQIVLNTQKINYQENI